VSTHALVAVVFLLVGVLSIAWCVLLELWGSRARRRRLPADVAVTHRLVLVATARR
jgi:Tfp pilus assembly protein PilV